jgi:methionyl-tRNA synthetase
VITVARKKFYVTTPIFYINDKPSVGSAFPAIIADIVARWHRIKGDDVFFLTGLDENSSKTVQAAKEQKKDIRKYADDMAGLWINAWKSLGISNDDFIRTIEERHRKNVEKFFAIVNSRGDIYKGKYVGLYCEGCEAFLTESDLVNGKCPLHDKEPKHIEEENYFFRLSKYQDRIMEHIKKNPEFIRPESRRNEVISFVKEGLKDISISRPYNGWGIKLPIDDKQVIWVWFDALINYLLPEKYWPADIHVVGKDIIRFHCVIWPGMLLSAGYKLPKRIFVHGFFRVNGQKMSKSLGNVIDPLVIVEKYSSDALRYYIIRGIPYGEDGDFSESSLITRINEELVSNYSNLFYRATYFVEKYFSGKLPEGKEERQLSDNAEKTVKEVDEYFSELRLGDALAAILALSSEVNKYFQESEPWESIKTDKKKAGDTLYNTINLLRTISTLLYPFIPSSCEKALNALGIKKIEWKDLGKSIKPGQKIKPIKLFEKIELGKEEESIKERSKKSDLASDLIEAIEMKDGMIPFSEFSKVDLRVGTITELKDHPNADKLYIVQVELGKEKRQLVAGLKGIYSKEELKGKQVIVVCNLEPKELKGVKSEGMLLASDDGTILLPEKKVKNGSKVM